MEQDKKVKKKIWYSELCQIDQQVKPSQTLSTNIETTSRKQILAFTTLSYNLNIWSEFSDTFYKCLRFH